MISYGPLWNTLARMNVSRPDFKAKCNLHSNTYAKLNRNEHISMKVIEDICKTMDCNIKDILEYVPDQQ